MPEDYDHFVEIPRLGRYQINRHGVVLHSYTGKALTTNLNMVSLIDGGNHEIQFYIPRLLVNTFIGIRKWPILTTPNRPKTELKYLNYAIDTIEPYAGPINRKSNCIKNDLVINGEIFKQIPDCPNYYMASDGLAYNRTLNTFIKNRYSRGYRIIRIKNVNGTTKKYRVQRIVYALYNSDERVIPDESIQIRFKDNHKWNCDIDNLYAYTTN